MDDRNRKGLFTFHQKKHMIYDSYIVFSLQHQLTNVYTFSSNIGESLDMFLSLSLSLPLLGTEGFDFRYFSFEHLLFSELNKNFRSSGVSFRV